MTHYLFASAERGGSRLTVAHQPFPRHRSEMISGGPPLPSRRSSLSASIGTDSGSALNANTPSLLVPRQPPLASAGFRALGQSVHDKHQGREPPPESWRSARFRRRRQATTARASYQSRIDFDDGSAAKSGKNDARVEGANVSARSLRECHDTIGGPSLTSAVPHKRQNNGVDGVKTA